MKSDDRSNQHRGVGSAIQFRDFQQTAAELTLSLSMIVNVNARADITKEAAVTGKSRYSGIIDPTVCTIVSTQSVLHSKIFVGVKMRGINF
jgi:hypothetical protein